MDLCSKPEAVNNYINTEAGPSYEMDGGYSPNKKEHICRRQKQKPQHTIAQHVGMEGPPSRYFIIMQMGIVLLPI